jgi:hypothetical protein
LSIEKYTVEQVLANAENLSVKQSWNTQINANKIAKRNEVNENMVEIIVDASELKDEGKQVVQALADFVKEKTGGEVTEDSNKLTVKGEGKAVSRKYLRVLVKKFLHKQELKDYYRVISGEEDTLKVKERKLAEED